LKIGFFGTPSYVLPVLTALHRKYVTGPGRSPIVAVVTQSPKPTGRKQILAYSPIDKWAHDHKIEIFYSAGDFLKNPVEADFGVCAAYGEIIPQSVINFFPKGILNIHPSLLPKYRGASPVQSAIVNGETETGVTIIKMDEKMDHGPIISQFKEEIDPADTGESLRKRLFEKSAEVLIELIDPYLKGKIKPRVQNDEEATFTKIVKREDGLVSLDKDDPEIIERKSRAYSPWPGIWTLLRLPGAAEGPSRRLKILKLHLDNGKLILDEVQLEGKNPVKWKQFEDAYLKSSPLS
jgi:methionyl-tRNA formyltransferase